MKSTTIICEEKQDKVILCDTGRAILNLNEREVETEETNGDETVTVTKYQYDSVTLDAPIQSVEAALVKVKELKTLDIEEYDNSTAVNEFSLNGRYTWYDKAKRVGLVNLIKSQKDLGEANTVLSDKGIQYEIPVDTALQMMAMLEVYAGKCYNVTDGHMAAVASLGDIESVFNYDFTLGYPDKLEFTA